MRQFAGACRFVYNKALALQKETYVAGGKFISYVAMAKHLTAWRGSKDTPWLKKALVHTSQQALKDLERAFVNFCEKCVDFPRFKRNVSRVLMQQMPIMLARSISWRQDIPCLPVEERCRQAARRSRKPPKRLRNTLRSAVGIPSL